MDFILKHFPASLRVKNFCHTCVVRPPQLTAACVTPLPSSTSPIRTPVVPHQNRRRHTLTISRPHLFANRLILEPTFVIDAVVRRHSLYIPLPPSRAPLSQSPPRNRRLLARHLPFNRDSCIDFEPSSAALHLQTQMIKTSSAASPSSPHLLRYVADMCEA